MSRNRWMSIVLGSIFGSLALFVAVSTGCEGACLVSPFRLESLNEIAEGLVIASVAALLFIVKPRVPSWLIRPIAPHIPRWLVVTLALSGVLVYVIFAVVDATYYSFASSYESGVAASVVWSLTVIFVAFRTGVVHSIRIFGLPSIVFSMVIILAANYLQMTSSISNLIQWDLNLRGWNYIPLVSNWSVLTIATVLCAREVATRFQRVPVAPCNGRCCPRDCMCGDCEGCFPNGPSRDQPSNAQAERAASAAA
jgi:hypothetical protein